MLMEDEAKDHQPIQRRPRETEQQARTLKARVILFLGRGGSRSPIMAPLVDLHWWRSSRKY